MNLIPDERSQKRYYDDVLKDFGVRVSSDLKRSDKMKDEDIDYSDSPPLDESFFKKEMVTLPQKKDSVTLRIDHDVLEFFKHQGKGYQTLINAVLKTYVHAKLLIVLQRCTAPDYRARPGGDRWL